jgi:hypothetical protein
MPAPRMALRIEEANGSWRKHSSLGTLRAVLLSDKAGELLAAWQSYGDGMAGHLSIAVASKNQLPHAWFLDVVQVQP